MIEVLKKVFSETDVLITTGSVSMGDRDLLKPILRDHFNAEIHFGSFQIRFAKLNVKQCEMENIYENYL